MPVHAYLLIALCATLLGGCGGDSPSARGPNGAPVRVLVQPLGIDKTMTRIEAVGTSRAIRSIELHPAASGEVDAVLFEPGERVEQGDVLVELDKRDAKLAVELARVRLADAQQLYERYQRSGSSGAVLPTQIDTARTAVESTRIELERAQVALDDKTIRAPFSGHVDITEVYPGDRISPDTLITTLDDRSALLVSFEVPELLTGSLKSGADVTLSTWNSRDEVFTGRIVEISSRIDPQTRTFVTRATVSNASDALRPGMSFRVSLNIDGAIRPVVPETALQWGADGAYIWTVKDGKAHREIVRIVQRQQGRVLIDTNVQEGQLIVVEGIQRMREGIDVSYDEQGFVDSDETPGGGADGLATDSE